MRGDGFSHIVDPDLRVSMSQSVTLSNTFTPHFPPQGAFYKIRGTQRL